MIQIDSSRNISQHDSSVGSPIDETFAAISFSAKKDTTQTCTLSIPDGTYHAYCHGGFVWFSTGSGRATGTYYMMYNDEKIESGTEIIGPGTLTGYARIPYNYCDVAYIHLAIAYGK